MPRPRYRQVSLEDTPFYHCISRCVRRAFLCGIDTYSGKSYEHRRDWVEARLLELAAVFAIDLCAYAVMSNHLHLVLRVDVVAAKSWTMAEVLQRWHRLYGASLLSKRFLGDEPLTETEQLTLQASAQTYRQRLMDISWFMRALNEPIARQANREDGCSGRFWEGRFKSQALLDDTAVLACMAYVDLNPIRAGIASTPEQSEFTSIKRRIAAALRGEQPHELLPFVGNEREAMPQGLHFAVRDYLQLVEDTGRILRDDKRGGIAPDTSGILTRLNIPLDNWLKLSKDFSRLFKGPVGTLEELSRYCEHLDRRRRQGAANCQKWFS
jgi:REP element-mobilizing transposase RayT